MRIFLSLLLLAGSPTFGATASPQNAHSSFSIVITAEKSVVKAGSDVWIKVQATNTSDHDMDCTMAPSSGLDRKYQYDIRDNSGHLAAKLARRHPELESGSILPCTLKPGQSTPQNDNRISRLYDFTLPGDYVIQVSRNDPKEGLAKSNKITIKVIP